MNMQNKEKYTQINNISVLFEPFSNKAKHFFKFNISFYTYLTC